MSDPIRTSVRTGVRLCAVHPLLPVTFVVISFGIAAFLVPSRHELAQRLFKDGSHLRAMQATLNIDAPATRESDVEQNRPQAEDLVTRVFLNPSLLPELTQDVASRELLAEGVILAPEPQRVLTALADLSGELTTEDREQLLRCVATRALDRGQPALAGLVFNQLVQLRPDAMSEEMLREVVRSWRANVQPAQALASLEAWMISAKVRGLTVASDLEDLRIQLLLETDHAAGAMDLLMARLEQEKTQGEVTQSTLERAVEIAGYCSRVVEMRPYVTAFLNSQPLGRASITEVAAALKDGKSPLLEQRGLWMRLAKDLAHWCEWTNASDEALELYEKLAVLGDAEGLQRVVEIGNDLGAGGSLLAVLDLVMTQPRNEIYAKDYGEALGLAGRLEEASTQYQTWLKIHPEDAKGVAEYAALCEERDDLDSALIAWRLAAKQEPENADYRKREAEVCLDLKRDREALVIYSQLPPDQHDSTTLENFALVAESLGEYPALNQALLARFKRLEHPHTPDFLELARSFELTGRNGEQLDYLRRGLATLPDSLNLRRQLASALRDADRNLEAVEVLEVATTRSDLRSMCIYLSAASRSDQYMRAATFLKNQIARRQDFPADVRLDLGHICYHTGQFDEARKFYASVDANAATWPLLAQACYQLGSYAEAEKYQRQYLSEMESIPAEQFIFLGDICRVSGKEEEADVAYNQALESIRTKHEAEIPPPPTPKVSASGLP